MPIIKAIEAVRSLRVARRKACIMKGMARRAREGAGVTCREPWEACGRASVGSGDGAMAWRNGVGPCPMSRGRGTLRRWPGGLPSMPGAGAWVVSGQGGSRSQTGAWARVGGRVPRASAPLTLPARSTWRGQRIRRRRAPGRRRCLRWRRTGGRGISSTSCRPRWRRPGRGSCG